MVICDLLIIITGIVGIFLSRRKGAALFYRITGVITAILSSGLLLTRIVHGHVVFRSVGLGNTNAMLQETVMRLQEQHAQSLYILFILTAIAAVLSFSYIYYSSRFGKVLPINVGKAMIITGILGLTGSICGIVFGQGAGERIPLVATWAMIAFIAMLTAGIAGSFRRRSPHARAIWGFAQLAVSTFCMLQTIYYAYSAIVRGGFFSDGQFIWLAALSGVFAISTVLSAYYMSDAAILKKTVNN